MKHNVYPRTYVRREKTKQLYRIDNVLAPDDEYQTLVEQRKKQGDAQMENYRPPLVRGCGLPAEQRRKRNKWKQVLEARNRSMTYRERKYNI